MARPRSKKNRNLPRYVMHRGGNYYLEPKGELLRRLGGRTSFPLGGDIVSMYAEYARILGVDKRINGGEIFTVGQLVDRYIREVVPTKSEDGQPREIRRAMMLKKVFGHMSPHELDVYDVYEFVEWRSQDAPIGVNRDLALLSAILKKGMEWRVIKSNPCHGVEYRKETPRTRYISDEEYYKFRDFAEEHNPIIARYIDFKYVTGLRTKDIRMLRRDKVESDGIMAMISKINQERLIEWSRVFMEVTERLAEACAREGVKRGGKIGRKKVCSDYILHTRDGTPYTASGWSSIFYRLMRKAIAEGVLQEPFWDHDIRAKAGSDHATLEEASRFLAHSSVKVTARHYRRKVERIKPLL